MGRAQSLRGSGRNVILLGIGGAIAFACTSCFFLLVIANLAEPTTVEEVLPTQASLAQVPTLPPTFTPRQTLHPTDTIQAAPTPEPTDTVEPPLAPTATFVPTLPPTPEPPIPTANPYTFVSTLTVDGWDIQVERVEVMSRIPGISDDSVPRGRYAVLFLAITNRQSFQDTFVPFGSVSLIDTYGREYEEDHLASSSAWHYFYADLGASIEPGETAHIVAAYDILGNDTDFYLGPGVLADPQPNRVLLQVPTAYTMAPAPRATETPFVFTGDDDYDPPSSGGDSGSGGSSSSGCCRVCRTGKACGNSCINVSYTCHQPPGCACNGSLPPLDVAATFREIALASTAGDGICLSLPTPGMADG